MHIKQLSSVLQSYPRPSDKYTRLIADFQASTDVALLLEPFVSK